MKKLFFTLLVFTVIGFTQSAIPQADSNRVLLEYCTGTWCGYCPCGHQIIESILLNYPNTMVIAYHGTSSDPWYSYSQAMLSAFGFGSYPTGVIGRTTGIISRSAWFGWVSAQSTYAPGVSLVLNNRTYNAATRVVTANAVVTALQNMPAGSYYINFILTESNIVYPQNFYAACGVAGYQNDYVHKHVNKGLINGVQGTLVTSSTWNQGTSFTIPLNYTIPSEVVAANCTINSFVYKSGASYSSDGAVQNTKEHTVPQFTPTGVIENELNASSYTLKQNYPNPFNPTTNIEFAVPKAGNAIFKIYDINGKEVATYLNQKIDAGVYKVEFDGSNLPSGVYFYRLTVNDFTETKMMTLVK
jgi:hypothetical protein